MIVLFVNSLWHSKELRRVIVNYSKCKSIFQIIFLINSTYFWWPDYCFYFIRKISCKEYKYQLWYLLFVHVYLISIVFNLQSLQECFETTCTVYKSYLLTLEKSINPHSCHTSSSLSITLQANRQVRHQF